MEQVSLDELAQATGGALSCSDSRRRVVTSVCIDSRSLKPGDVFWAIRGPRFDGHDFVEDAFRRGAVAAVVERPAATDCGPIVTVRDSVVALGAFAKWYRSLLDAFVIGITGSVGKTTTRELVFAALGGAECATRSRKNFNNRIGVPLTLLDVRKNDQFSVIEMGADRVGDISRLAGIARPEIGIITRLGIAHVETFGSEEAIVRAKGELIESLPTGGLAVLPGDQSVARRMRSRTRAETVLVGSDRSNDVVVKVTDVRPDQLDFTVDRVPFRVPANGSHFAVTAGMAVVVARHLGRTDAQISKGLRHFEHVPGRCRVALRSPWTLIDDSYNANPDSMRAALDALARWPAKGRRVLVCGDMYGLGSSTAQAHITLGREAAQRGIDQIVAIGQQTRHVVDGAISAGFDARRLAVFSDRQSAAEWLATILNDNDVVWVKASRPLELERLVEDLIAVANGAAFRLRPAA